MKRISSEVEAKIIEMWFQGAPRDEIARALMVAQGTVSTVIGSLPSCLEPLRDLSKTLRKLGIPPNAALEGANLLGLLAEYGVNPEQIRTFLGTVRKTSTEAGVQPREAVQASIKIADLESQVHASYPEALRRFEVLTQQIIKGEKNHSKLLLKTRKSKRLFREAFKQAKSTPQELSEFLSCKAALRRYGIDINDLETIHSALNNIKEAGGDCKLFVSLIKRHSLITKADDYLEKQLTIKQDKLANLQSQIKKRQPIVRQLKYEETHARETINSQEEAINVNNYHLNQVLANIAELEKLREALITWIGQQLNLPRSEIDNLRLNSQYDIVLAMLDNELRDAQARLRARW